MPMLEQIVGGLLMLLVLADVFLTVLYARMGTGLISLHLARGTWSMFRMLGRAAGPRRGKVLSFCGPTILVLLVMTWGLGLTLGAAMVLHPHLGTSIKASSGPTSRDFITAMFAGGGSISIVGSGSYSPQNGWLKMFYLFNSLVGMSVISLTLTYLMQIYTALKQRNSLGLNLHIGTSQKGDAAELIAGLGPQGKFDIGYTTLVNLSDSLAQTKEAHHFYPVLFYFRFEEPFYSVSRVTNVALDAVALIQCALDPEEYQWLLGAGAVAEIHDASLLLLGTLQETFLPGGKAGAEFPNEPTRELWRQRFLHAVERLRSANISMISDVETAADRYIAQRARWSTQVQNLAQSMLYSEEEIDPALVQAAGAVNEHSRALRENGTQMHTRLRKNRHAS